MRIFNSGPFSQSDSHAAVASAIRSLKLVFLKLIGWADAAAKTLKSDEIFIFFPSTVYNCFVKISPSGQIYTLTIRGGTWGQI